MKTTTQIAINFGHTYKAITAEIVTILGVELALHRTPNKSGWSVSCPKSGLAICSKCSTKDEALSSAQFKLKIAGVDKFRALVAKQKPAPPVEGLEVYTPPVPQAKGDLDTIVELIAERAGLSDVEKTAVRSAFSSRSCRLKAKAPSAFGDAVERLAAAAWQGLQPNGYKIGIYAVISLRGEAKDLYDKLSKFQWPSAFDKDRAALEKLGVW